MSCESNVEYFVEQNDIKEGTKLKIVAGHDTAKRLGYNSSFAGRTLYVENEWSARSKAWDSTWEGIQIIGTKKLNSGCYCNLFWPFQADKIHMSWQMFDIFRKLDLPLPKKEDCGIDYLDIAIEDDSKISYITKNREDKFAFEHYHTFYNKELREKYAYMGKIGKVLKKIYPSETDDFIRTTTSKIKAKLTEMKAHFAIVNNVSEWYNVENYYNEKGSLGSSCMRHSSCSAYMKFYENNNVQLVTLLKEGKLTGRALLWHNVKYKSITTGEEGTFSFMDRIYVNNDNDVEKFKEFAEKLGFAYKQEQSCSSGAYVIFNSKEHRMQMEYKAKRIKCKDNDKYSVGLPYADTFSYYHGYGRPTLNNYNKNSDYAILNETDGEPSGFVVYNGYLIPEQMVFYKGNDEYELRSKGLYLNGDSEWVLKGTKFIRIGRNKYKEDSSYIRKIKDKYYHINDLVRAYTDGTTYDYALKEDCVYGSYLDSFILKSNAQKVTCGRSFDYEIQGRGISDITEWIKRRSEGVRYYVIKSRYGNEIARTTSLRKAEDYIKNHVELKLVTEVS